MQRIGKTLKGNNRPRFEVSTQRSINDRFSKLTQNDNVDVSRKGVDFRYVEAVEGDAISDLRSPAIRHRVCNREITDLRLPRVAPPPYISRLKPRPFNASVAAHPRLSINYDRDVLTGEKNALAGGREFARALTSAVEKLGIALYARACMRRGRGRVLHARARTRISRRRAAPGDGNRNERERISVRDRGAYRASERAECHFSDLRHEPLVLTVVRRTYTGVAVRCTGVAHHPLPSLLPSEVSAFHSISLYGSVIHIRASATCIRGRSPFAAPHRQQGRATRAAYRGKVEKGEEESALWRAGKKVESPYLRAAGRS